jgi:hypothetical protein
MSGADRAMLYRLAVGTGFRAGELRSLSPETFRLGDDPPTVKVPAAYSKRRRDDLQPIRPDLAEHLGPWLAGSAPTKPVFNMPEKTAKMLRRDLESAEIAYRDASGRVADFHAFRHTYVSMLVRSGASVKVAQELARHSTPTLTIGCYTHADMGTGPQRCRLCRKSRYVIQPRNQSPPIWPMPRHPTLPSAQRRRSGRAAEWGETMRPLARWSPRGSTPTMSATLWKWMA